MAKRTTKRLTAERSAVIYARYSSDKQRDTSIDQQIDECSRYARREGLTVVRVYADRAISGRSDDRPEFQHMVSDAKSHTFSKVIVYKLDRFARNTYDSAIYRKRLDDEGVSVVSATEGIPDSPEGRLLESVITGVAEWYSADLSQKSRRGMRDNAKKALYNGAVVYGYRCGKDRRYEIVPDEAEMIRLMFAGFLAGKSYGELADEMAARGVRSSYGTPVTKAWVERHIHNEAYMGTYRWDDIVVDGGMPAIVDPETWRKAQERGRGARSLKHKRDYPLVGRLIEAESGRKMMGYSSWGKQHKEYLYYALERQGRGKGRSRDRITVSLPKVHAAVCASVMAVLADDDVRTGVAMAMVERSQVRASDAILRRERLEERLAEVERSQANLLRAVERGLDLDGIDQRSAELAGERRLLRAQLDAEEVPFLPTLEECEAVLGALLDRCSEVDVLEHLVESVVYDRSAQTVETTFTIMPGTAKTDLQSRRSEVELEKNDWCPIHGGDSIGDACYQVRGYTVTVRMSIAA